MINKALGNWAGCFAAILLALSGAAVSAATFHIDISPAPGTALNLNGVNLYNGDHAIGGYVEDHSEQFLGRDTLVGYIRHQRIPQAQPQFNPNLGIGMLSTTARNVTAESEMLR